MNDLIKKDQAKILIIDDDIPSREFLKKKLIKLGFFETQIHFAKNGAEALRIITLVEDSGDNFDVIITDCNMDTMNGMEFVGRFRVKEGDIKNAQPIVMSSSENDENFFLTAIHTGVNSFLQKPYNDAAIKSALRNFVHI